MAHDLGPREEERKEYANHLPSKPIFVSITIHTSHVTRISTIKSTTITRHRTIITVSAGSTVTFEAGDDPGRTKTTGDAIADMR